MQAPVLTSSAGRSATATEQEQPLTRARRPAQLVLRRGSVNAHPVVVSPAATGVLTFFIFPEVCVMFIW